MSIRYNIFKNKYIDENISSMELLRGGVLFFQLSITQTIIWGTGILLVSHMLLLQDVTVYSLTMKIYVYIFYAFIIINTVIAPLYGRYYSENAWVEIRKIFNLSILLLPFLGGFIWIGTLYFMSDIIAIWTGSSEFYVGSLFILFMGVFFYFTGYINSYITLLYSIGEVKSIINIRWKEVMANLLISIIMTYFIGLTGIAIGMSLAIALISAKYLPMYLEKKSKGEIVLNFTIQKKHFILVLLPNIIIAFIVTTFVDVLSVKLFIFIFMSVLYILFSWYILASEDKNYIISFLNYKKGHN